MANPQVDMSGTMESFPLKGCVQPEVAAVLQGSISGVVHLGGSPYGSSGITASAQVDLGPEDEVIVTDQVELFDVISLVDRYRSYKKGALSLWWVHDGNRQERRDVFEYQSLRSGPCST